MFKDIPGFEGRYRIDQYGNVQRVYKKKNVQMIPLLRDGDPYIRLTGFDGKRREYTILRLMQLTFFLPAPPGHILHRKNGNKQDNWINNLVYTEQKELGRQTGARARRKPVAKLSPNGEVVAFYSSAREAARHNFMSYQTIMDYCNRRHTKQEFAPDGFNYCWKEDVIYDKDGNARLPKRRRNHHDQRNANQQL